MASPPTTAASIPCRDTTPEATTQKKVLTAFFGMRRRGETRHVSAVSHTGRLGASLRSSPTRPQSLTRGESARLLRTPAEYWQNTCTQRARVTRATSSFAPECASAEGVPSLRNTHTNTAYKKHHTGRAKGAPPRGLRCLRTADNGWFVGGAPAGARPVRGWLIPRIPYSRLVPQASKQGYCTRGLSVLATYPPP